MIKGRLFEIGSLAIFRQNYLQGKNYVASPLVKTPYKQCFGKLAVQFCNVNLWIGI
jgi:hypothetical protein